jgi:phosphate starvation-inducible PhoH-like protein
LAEKKITLNGIDPIEIYGARNSKLDLIKSYYPKLKIIARGSEITVLGEEEVIEQFETKLAVLILHFNKYNRLTESNIDRLIMEDHTVVLELDDDVIVHGNHGKLIKARTSNQRKMVDLCLSKDMVFAIGPAGTGKTYTAVALAVRALKNKEVKRVILTRPAVEAGENLGFLPGDMKDKLDPYMQPLYDALNDMIPSEKLKALIEERVIQIAPLAFMRGRTLDNAFVILDEAQNTTVQQMKMFLTRMGRSAKFVVTGDVTQVDLPARQKSGLNHCLGLLSKVNDIGIVYLNEKDVIRHNLVMQIIQAYKEEETRTKKEKESGKHDSKN